MAGHDASPPEVARWWRPVASPRRRLPSSPPSCWSWSPEHSSRSARSWRSRRVPSWVDRYAGLPVSVLARPHPGGRGGSGAVHREQPDRDERRFLATPVSDGCSRTGASSIWGMLGGGDGLPRRMVARRRPRGRRDGTLQPPPRPRCRSSWYSPVRASSRTRWSVSPFGSPGSKRFGDRQGRGDRLPDLGVRYTEHSVANMFFILMGLALRGQGDVVDAAHIPSAELSTSTVRDSWKNNLVATIGNVIEVRCWSGSCTGSSTSARRARPDVAGP